MKRMIFIACLAAVNLAAAEYGPDMSVIKDLSVGGNATITGSLAVDGTSLSVGSTPASTGTIRVRNNGSMKYRNATDNGDFDFLAWSSGTIDIGGISSSTINITNNATDQLNLVTGPVVASSSVQGAGFLSSSTGSADVAGYAFSADTNTGINRTAADTLGIQVGGAIVAEFSADSEYHSGDIKIGSTWATKTLNFCDSNWGIKTNSPNNSLDVFGYGANDATRQFRVTDHNGNSRLNVDFYTGNVTVQSTNDYAAFNVLPKDNTKYAYINFGDGSTYGWQLGKDLSANGGNLYLQSYLTGHQGVRLTVTPDGNVGIGTSAPTPTAAGSLDVHGYTCLGDGSPAIKIKKLTTTPTGIVEGGTVSLAHGLTLSKIISVTSLVGPATIKVHPNMTDAGYQYQWYVDGTNVTIQFHATNSESIINQPIVVTIIYEE